MHYELATHYAGQLLLDGFSFFTGDDPNGGFVKYVLVQLLLPRCAVKRYMTLKEGR